MRKIVITGGPCAGKTRALQAMPLYYAGRVLIVPEVATMLLSSGFPKPGPHLPWSPDWQRSFQAAVAAVQPQVERAYALQAQQQGIEVLICDRGLLDGAAYTPGGLAAFCELYGVKVETAVEEYGLVIHLESVATGEPTAYGNTGNETRFETLDEAVRLEQATRRAWEGHPGWRYIDCKGGMQTKIHAVMDLIERSLP